MVRIEELCTVQSSVSSWDGMRAADEDDDDTEAELPAPTAPPQWEMEGGEGRTRFVRTYTKEGPVRLLSGLVTQQRYLFLFSDLLLVAKPKRENSYKLKEKLSLSELWLSGTWPPGVAELAVEPGLGFLLGWPTTNVVAVFASRAERDSWLQLLREKVAEERERAVVKTAAVTVRCKAAKPQDDALLRLQVTNGQTADDLLRLAVCEMGLGPEPASAYQLWLRSPSQSAPYPLLGLESPLAIVLSHLRDSLPNAGSHDELRQLADHGLDAALLSLHLEFVLRPRSSHTHLVNIKPSMPQTARSGSSKPRRAFVDRFRLMRQKLSRQDSGTEEGRDRSVDRSASSRKDRAVEGILEAVEIPCEGLLFGRPLAQVASGGVDGLPTAIHDVFVALHRHGLTSDGLFRKPPKQRALRDLRAALDRGESPDWDTVQPNLAASLLKEFLRSVPGKLLLPGQYFDWVALSDPAPQSLKVAKAKSLVGELGPERVALLRHLLCLVHRVAAHSAQNQMDLHSLSVCLGPCLIDRPPHAQTQHSFKLLPLIALFLFQNASDIFGEATLSLLPGEKAEEPSTSTQSEKAATSALNKHLQTHASHDSGLSEDCLPDGRRALGNSERSGAWSSSQSPDHSSESSHEPQGDASSTDSAPIPALPASASPKEHHKEPLERAQPRPLPQGDDDQPQASSSGISTSSRDSLSSIEGPQPFPGRLRPEDAASAPLPIRSAPKSSMSYPQTSLSPSSAHDSSTVTETEDEDDSGDETPVVSRQSSKATELETKVRAMFPSPATVARADTTKVRKAPGPPGSSILKRPSLPSYAEAIARRDSGGRAEDAPSRPVRDRIRRYDREQLRRKTLGGAEHLQAAAQSQAPLPPRHREGRRGSAGVCALIRSHSRPRESTAASSPAPVFPSETRTPQPVITATASCHITCPRTSRRFSAGSFATEEPKVKLESSHLSTSALRRSGAEADRVGARPERRALRPPSSEISWSVQNLRQKFSEAAEERLGEAVREKNYAVVRPPPLPSSARSLSVSQLSGTRQGRRDEPRLRPAAGLPPSLPAPPRPAPRKVAQKEAGPASPLSPSSKVRSLASSFESGQLPSPQLNQESYV